MPSILHVDMDAFYASVEQRDDPRLRGKPVIVGGSPQGRGVVAAASYEARAFGVRSAMPASQAARLCPHAIWREPDFDRYTADSRRILAILRSTTPLVEPLSLDEAFLDLRGTERLLGPPEGVGRALKARILAETGLVASVGVAPNKLLAKLASDLDKPDGFLVVREGEERAFLAPLPVERISGVGKKLGERLESLGLRRIGDLAERSREELERILGSAGGWLHDLAFGKDDRPVLAHREEKSHGTERTFERDVADASVLRRVLLEDAEEIAADLRGRGLLARTVAIKVRYPDFRTVTRSRTLDVPTALAARIHAVAGELVAALAPRRVRLLGLYAENLLDATGARQLALFGEEGDPDARRLAAERGMDEVRRRHGPGAVRPAALLEPAAVRAPLRPPRAGTTSRSPSSTPARGGRRSPP
ncbi:MAG: DNA polymerase IV [Planctomycetes bacterium]|nr:DNA polymerase IV [Planctomycetota bacterium]